MRSRLSGTLAVLTLVLALTFSVAWADQVVIGTDGMVASAHELASRAGAQILGAGGNAIDAAVATAFAITVVEPNASSLGGEGYMVISLADGQDVAIDFRSWAPGHLTVDVSPETLGPKSTMIPGLVAGLTAAQEEFGVLSLAEVLQPAIALAREGFPLDRQLAGQLANVYENFVHDPVVGPIYYPNMLIPEEGEQIVNKDLARALELIAAKGSDAFYTGEIAAAIVEATEGWIREEDLEKYSAVIREPVITDYRGYTVVSAPPVVAGALVGSALNIIENFDMREFEGWDDPMAVHVMSQALLLADADWARYIADPDFYDVPLEGLLSKDYAADRAQLVNLEQAMFPPWIVDAGDPYPYMESVETTGSVASMENDCTTHISAVDTEGNAASVTQTISSFWGSQVMVPGYGFFLSNHARLFSGDPDHLNSREPYKRVRTMIAPTIVRYADGGVYMVLGTPGAARIPSSVVGTIVNVVDFEMSLEEAIRAPKFASRPVYIELRLEGGYPEETVAALEQLGHAVRMHDELDLFFGGLNAVIVDEDGVMTGVGSFRRDGAAATP